MELCRVVLCCVMWRHVSKSTATRDPLTSHPHVKNGGDIGSFLLILFNLIRCTLIFGVRSRFLFLQKATWGKFLIYQLQTSEVFVKKKLRRIILVWKWEKLVHSLEQYFVHHWQKMFIRKRKFHLWNQWTERRDSKQFWVPEGKWSKIVSEFREEISKPGDQGTEQPNLRTKSSLWSASQRGTNKLSSRNPAEKKPCLGLLNFPTKARGCENKPWWQPRSGPALFRGWGLSTKERTDWTFFWVSRGSRDDYVHTNLRTKSSK